MIQLLTPRPVHHSIHSPGPGGKTLHDHFVHDFCDSVGRRTTALLMYGRGDIPRRETQQSALLSCIHMSALMRCPSSKDCLRGRRRQSAPGQLIAVRIPGLFPRRHSHGLLRRLVLEHSHQLHAEGFEASCQESPMRGAITRAPRERASRVVIQGPPSLAHALSRFRSAPVIKSSQVKFIPQKKAARAETHFCAKSLQPLIGGSVVKE